ncbi:hypothetical protein OAK19_02440, partial [Aureispira]|nr:hypothetical protein [Aureispira sp.]
MSKELETLLSSHKDLVASLVSGENIEEKLADHYPLINYLYHLRNKNIIALNPKEGLIIHNIINMNFKKNHYNDEDILPIFELYKNMKAQLLPYVNEDGKDLFIN